MKPILHQENPSRPVGPWAAWASSPTPTSLFSTSRTVPESGRSCRTLAPRETEETGKTNLWLNKLTKNSIKSCCGISISGVQVSPNRALHCLLVLQIQCITLAVNEINVQLYSVVGQTIPGREGHNFQPPLIKVNVSVSVWALDENPNLLQVHQNARPLISVVEWRYTAFSEESVKLLPYYTVFLTW